MRKVLKMVGIVSAVVIVLSLAIGTIAMAAGPGEGDGSGTCINSECPGGSQCSGECQNLGDCPNTDCLCDGSQQQQMYRNGESCQLQQQLQQQNFLCYGEGQCLNECLCESECICDGGQQLQLQQKSQSNTQLQCGLMTQTRQCQTD